jgi:uncharacterized membrane protein
MNLNNLSKLGIAICFIGILVSSYLLYARLSGGELICGVSSCNTVNSSNYSVLLGVPLSAWGMLFYVGMIVLLLVRKYKLFYLGSIVGVLFSAYLTFLEFFVIKAWCQWCLLSAWLTVCLFVVGVRVRKGKDVLVKVEPKVEPESKSKSESESESESVREENN